MNDSDEFIIRDPLTEAQSELVENNLNLAKEAVLSYPNEDGSINEDLMCIAEDALIEAAGTFKNQARTFEIFATKVINDYIISYLRSIDHVSEKNRRKINRMQKVIQGRTIKGLPLDKYSICEELDMPRAKYEELRVKSNFEMVYVPNNKSFDYYGIERSISGTTQLDDLQEKMQDSLEFQSLLILRDYSKDLSDREYLAILLYLIKKGATKEITRIVGVSRARVWQLLQDSVPKIKKLIKHNKKRQIKSNKINFSGNSEIDYLIIELLQISNSRIGSDLGNANIPQQKVKKFNKRMFHNEIREQLPEIINKIPLESDLTKKEGLHISRFLNDTLSGLIFVRKCEEEKLKYKKPIPEKSPQMIIEQIKQGLSAIVDEMLSEVEMKEYEISMAKNILLEGMSKKEFMEKYATSLEETNNFYKKLAKIADEYITKNHQSAIEKKDDNKENDDEELLCESESF